MFKLVILLFLSWLNPELVTWDMAGGGYKSMEMFSWSVRRRKYTLISSLFQWLEKVCLSFNSIFFKMDLFSATNLLPENF